MRSSWSIVVVVALCHQAHAEVATYGIQRTHVGNTPLWRDGSTIVLTLDADTIPANARPAIAAAAAAWRTASASCSELSFAIDVRVPGEDDHDTVHLRTDHWCPPGGGACFAPDAASVTTLTYVDDPSDPDDGKILGADVELNAVDFELLVPGATAATTKPALDLQSVVTHELGHVLGLAHDCGTGQEPWPTDELGRRVPACAAAAPAVTTATMYVRIQPDDLGGRTPEAGDVAGACSTVRPSPDDNEVTGGCSAGAGSGLGFVVVFVGLLRRRRL